MNDLSSYSQSTADWRKQLAVNDSKTIWVIAIFVALYVMIGLIVDLYLHPELNRLPLWQALDAFLTLQVTPIATLILGGVAILSIFVTFAFHDKIMLFGTEYREITPTTAKSLVEKQFYNVIEEMKVAAGLRYMPRVFLIEADYMNAFASGYSEKSALVAITRGLLQKLERDELQAVMAHELSHIRHHDIKLTLMASVLSNIMLLVIDLLFYNMLFSGRRESDDDERGGGNFLFIIVIVLRYLLPVLNSILMLWLSRTREYMADAGAVELTRDNVPLARALLKISQDHQNNQEACAAEYAATPHEEVRSAAYIFDPSQAGISAQKSFATMFSTHPAIKDRLKALGFKPKP